MENETQNKRKYGLGEICQETMKEIEKSIPSQFLEGIVKGVVTPFMLPSVARLMGSVKENDTSQTKGFDSRDYADSFGYLAGLGTEVISTFVYLNKAKLNSSDVNNVLTAMAALAATNVLSWGYEKYCQAKKNLDKKYAKEEVELAQLYARNEEICREVEKRNQSTYSK